MEKQAKILIGTLLIVCLAAGAYGQSPASQLGETTREIRVRKIVADLQGQVILLETIDKQLIKGRLEGVSGGAFNMTRGDQLELFPIDSVSRIILKPGVTEIALTSASAIMGAVFFGGALSLTADEVSDNAINLTAIVGLMGGALWGYSTFYNSEIIELE